MREIRIRFLPCKDFHDIGVPSYVRGLAYTNDDICVVCEDHFDLELLAHELGHCFGKNHTILPSVMNPSGAFRWFSNPLRTILLIIRHWRNRPRG